MAQQSNEVELHKGMCVRHELAIGDETLVEEQRWISVTVPKSSDTKSRIIKTHKLQIGDKSVTTVEENEKKKRISNLSQKEQDELEDKWEELWMPKISKEKIEKVVKAEVDGKRLEEVQFKDMD